MGEPEREWNLSACGLNCAKCDIYMASHGDEGMRASIVDWFRDERNVNLKPEQVRCEGCMGDPERHWSPDWHGRPGAPLEPRLRDDGLRQGEGAGALLPVWRFPLQQER